MWASRKSSATKSREAERLTEESHEEAVEHEVIAGQVGQMDWAEGVTW